MRISDEMSCLKTNAKTQKAAKTVCGIYYIAVHFLQATDFSFVNKRLCKKLVVATCTYILLVYTTSCYNE